MVILYLLLLLLFLVLASTFFLYLIISNCIGAPFVPSKKRDIGRIVELAEIRKGDVIYDIGSGDGRLLIEAAKAGAKKCIGIEVNPILVKYSRIKAKLSGQQDKIEVRRGNIWKEKIDQVDTVFTYFIPAHMERLGKKLKKELKPGTKIISNKFKFPNLEEKYYDKESQIFVYKIR